MGGTATREVPQSPALPLYHAHAPPFNDRLVLTGVPFITSILESTCRQHGTVPPAQLRQLNIKNCQWLEVLPEEMPELVYLTITHCRALRGLTVAPKLERLQIHNCAALHTLDASALAQSLTFLELDRCVFTVLPDALCALIKLQTLQIIGCDQLTCLPPFLGNLCKLQSLRVRSCPLMTALPESMGDLVLLDLLESSVSHMNLLQLPRIQIVILSHPTCSDLYQGLMSTHMIHLKLTNCDALTALPDALASLAALRELHIDQAPVLTFVPGNLSGMVGLEKLFVKGCPRLTRILGLGDLRAVRHIFIHHCGITALPDSLNDLSALRDLSLVGCDALTCLPVSIGHIDSLRSLNLDGTRCHRLPASLGYRETLTLYNRQNITFPPPNVRDMLQFLRRNDKPCCILLLAMAARRYNDQSLPSELWAVWLEDFYLLY